MTQPLSQNICLRKKGGKIHRHNAMVRNQSDPPLPLRKVKGKPTPRISSQCQRNALPKHINFQTECKRPHSDYS